MSRGRIAIAVLVVLIGAIALFMRHDLALSDDDKPRDLPNIAVDDFSFKRTINGRSWRVDAVSAEHRDENIIASVMNVAVEEMSGDSQAELHAVCGVFSQDISLMTMYDVTGGISFDGGLADASADVAAYDTSTGVWTFDEGMVISSDTVRVQGTAASIDADGVFTFGRGVRAKWHIDQDR